MRPPRYDQVDRRHANRRRVRERTLDPSRKAASPGPPFLYRSDKTQPIALASSTIPILGRQRGIPTAFHAADVNAFSVQGSLRF